MLYKVLKFVGKYGELKNHGYKFCRLFAGNYMTWFKKTGGEYSSNNIWIFKKGADVEFKDFYHMSGLVGEFVRDNDPIKPFPTCKLCWRIVIDNDGAVFANEGGDRYNSMSYFSRDENNKYYQETPQEEKDQMIPDMNYEEFSKRFRTDMISLEFGNAMRELMNSGMVEIQDEELKSLIS